MPSTDKKNAKEPKPRKSLLSKKGVYRKYRVFDYETGEEKKSQYFCLNLRPKSDKEFLAVRTALLAYAGAKLCAGDRELGVDVEQLVHFETRHRKWEKDNAKGQ